MHQNKRSRLALLQKNTFLSRSKYPAGCADLITSHCCFQLPHLFQLVPKSPFFQNYCHKEKKLFVLLENGLAKGGIIHVL